MKAAAKEAEARVVENPWLERVRAYVARPSTPKELLIPAIFEALSGNAYESRNLVDGRQIAAALRDLGFVRRIREGVRVYVRDWRCTGERLVHRLEALPD